MEEADAPRDGDGGVGTQLLAGMEIMRHRRVPQRRFIGRPEPHRTPFVHGPLERLKRLARFDVPPIVGFLFVRVIDRQLVQFLELCAGLGHDLIGCGVALAKQEPLALELAFNDLPHLLLDKPISRPPVSLLLAFQERLDPLGPGTFLAVAALALPGRQRIVQHAVQPAADQRVADLDLVVEERERQFGVERFHPQRYTGKLDGQRVNVHAVDAALHNMPPQEGLDPIFKGMAPLGVVGRKRHQFLVHLAGARASVRQRQLLGLFRVVQPAMMAERLVQGVSQVMESGHQE